MDKNIIILTCGLSGSSVLTKLLISHGFWSRGDNDPVECARTAYLTHENPRLVSLNIGLLQQSGYLWEDPADIPPPSTEALSKLIDQLDLAPYQAFLEQCREHSPWIWKDPRLSYTIHFWQHLIDMGNIRFILLTREYRQIWIGQILRANCQIEYKHLTTVQDNASTSSKIFLEERQVEYHHLIFEDLLTHPKETLDNLGVHLGVELSVERFRGQYHGKLGRKRWNGLNLLRAQVIHGLHRHLLRDHLRFPRYRMDN